MKGSLQTRVRPQFYLDSVALMRMSRSLATQDGVQDAAMMMATPANIEILTNAGLLDAQSVNAGPGDHLMCVRAHSQDIAAAAMDDAERLLETPLVSKTGDAWRPRSIRSAMEHLPSANLALISVPGAFAVSEARKAIRRGLNAMIFSDNVPLAAEVSLKQEARELGRLVMGPDCGTAIINGVPLAFANRLPRGDIGIIGASGTGIQEISCLLAGLGQGISHAIGVGGRDLHTDVGGISTLMAMDILENDETTRHVVLVSKPPASDVAASVIQRITNSSKTFTVCFIGGDQPELPSNASWADTLTAAAEDAGKAHLAVADSHNASPAESSDSAIRGSLLRGLYCGGTLCAEAQVICRQAQLEVSSNAAIPGVQGAVNAAVHTLIDLGADEYTQGKPHPMIDPAVRDAAIAEAIDDSNTAAILVDVVIGYGAHANPAVHLVANLPTGSRPPIFASVTGSDNDPQNRSQQLQILREAGIVVAASNANAVELAIARLRQES